MYKKNTETVAEIDGKEKALSPPQRLRDQGFLLGV
jgi:hypothetical protein